MKDVIFVERDRWDTRTRLEKEGFRSEGSFPAVVGEDGKEVTIILSRMVRDLGGEKHG
jgi:hypothetical protein